MRRKRPYTEPDRIKGRIRVMSEGVATNSLYSNIPDWEANYYYAERDIVKHKEGSDATRVYMSLFGDDLSYTCPNVGNNPFTNPASWSLIEEVK